MAIRCHVLVLVLAAAGCHHTPVPVGEAAREATALPVTLDLPLTQPTVPVLDGKSLPKAAPRTVAEPDATEFRRLTEIDCQRLASANCNLANLLDDENRIPSGKSGTQADAADQLRHIVRYHAALELRNRAAADALERFFQLTDAEARTDLLRKAFPILDDLHTKATAAKAAEVRFPLDTPDLERQRSQLVSQLEQAELGSRLLNLDLKRRLALPAVPVANRLWPAGDFTIDATPVDAEQAVTAALADRPELRGLRAFYHGLTPETLPDVREFLRGSPLFGQARLPLPIRGLLRFVGKSAPESEVAAELEVRRKQLFELIAERERAVADETRAAALSLTAQQARAILARDRVISWEDKLNEVGRKRDANQPGVGFLEPQVRLELLKAKAEMVAEVATWHQARVRLKAAQGWLAWENLPGK